MGQVIRAEDDQGYDCWQVICTECDKNFQIYISYGEKEDNVPEFCIYCGNVIDETEEEVKELVEETMEIIKNGGRNGKR